MSCPSSNSKIGRVAQSGACLGFVNLSSAPTSHLSVVSVVSDSHLILFKTLVLSRFDQVSRGYCYETGNGIRPGIVYYFSQT